MTLDEAIKYCEEMAEKQRSKAHVYEDMMVYNQTIKHNSEAEYYEELMNECYKCAEEYRQFAEWLRELREYKEKENCNKPYWAEMEILSNAYDIMGVKTWASKLRCSNCNFITYAIEGKLSQYNYCPQCGKQIGAKYEEVNADDTNRCED